MPRSAVIVVCDRWGAGFVGPYGNTWLETPSWNRFASEGFLAENHLADAADLETIYRSYWMGKPAWKLADNSPPSLPQIARAAGVKTVLITDEPLLVQHPLAGDFDELISLPPGEMQTQENLEQTAAAQVLDEAYDWLLQANEPFLLWVHVQALAGPWDAPYPLRAELADETDPPPPELVVPPELRLSEDVDPDLLLGFQQAYGGQVRALDACLAPLWSLREDRPALQGALWLFTSPRGFPLGEHQRVGPCDGALFGELLHTPLVVCLPEGVGRLSRTQRFSQPFDLYDAIRVGADWSPGELSSMLAAARGEEAALRNWGAAVGAQERAFRTSAWFYREKQGGEEAERQLFAKPDDRWEANEVAARCGEIVTSLVEELDQLQERPVQPATLPAELENCWR